MKLEIKDESVILKLEVQEKSAAEAAAAAARAEQALSNIYTGKATGTHITYEKNKVYHLPTAPGTGAITQNNEGAIFGISQKIYHQSDVIPPMPETWVRMGGSYDTGQLNTIYVEWISEDRQEYWIQKDNPTSAEDVVIEKANEAVQAASIAVEAAGEAENVKSQVELDKLAAELAAGSSLSARDEAVQAAENATSEADKAQVLVNGLTYNSGATDELTTYEGLTNPSSNSIKGNNKFFSTDGYLKQISMYCNASGTIKINLFAKNSSGTYTLYWSKIFTCVLGVNAFKAEIDFDPVMVYSEGIGLFRNYANQGKIGFKDRGNGSLGGGSVDIPIGESISFTQGNSEYALFFMIQNGSIPDKVNSERLKVLEKKVIVVSPSKRFAGKRLFVTGDSITAGGGATTTKLYHQYLAEWMGFSTVTNDGKSGTGLVKPSGSVKGMIERLPTWPVASQIDMISIMGNMNDGTTAFTLNSVEYPAGLPLGSFSDNTPDKKLVSVYGALHFLFQHIISNYPLLPVNFIISTPREYEAVGGKSWGTDGWFESWCSAIKAVCGHYSIPVLDLYHNSGLRPWNLANRNAMFGNFTAGQPGDGIHPNAKGHELMAYKIFEFWNQNL